MSDNLKIQKIKIKGKKTKRLWLILDGANSVSLFKGRTLDGV